MTPKEFLTDFDRGLPNIILTILFYIGGITLIVWLIKELSWLLGIN